MIFVSIVSYRDSELVPTIKSLLKNADKPREISLGVVSQDIASDHPDLSFVKKLSYLKMDFRDARGVGYARKIAMDLYNGEDFYLQIDSHMRFEKSWDTQLIDMIKQTQEISNNKKVILSQFPAPYEIHTNGKEFYPQDNPELWTAPSWSKVHNRDFGGWSAERQKIEDLSVPHPTHTLLAGYIFSTGNFVKEIPYDERISFMGEELCLALRSYTRGWDLYAPNKMLLWHYYKRKRSPKIWGQMDDSLRDLRWIELEMESKRVQKNILTGKEEGIYGIGSHEKYIEYQNMIGFDFSDFYDKVINKKINDSVKTQEIIF
jgi:hypothetical protein